ncbi:ABC transporter substrate-binding protein [uncultured Parolsenella sp.]|uniref:ABC transporter substrate-binding protein n=1 Tax=uncultured Parolsenella sp. TaxID=2083008 RepID=UPI0027DD6612|nr:ABC transporter substrate-binding protein [uncultured Parolsenella sp.]
MSKSISRRSFVAGAAAAAATCGLAACGGSGAAATTEAASTAASGDATKLTFVLDYTPNTNHSGVYVAIAKGYYADENLDVEVVQPPEDGADALVGTGKAQVGMGYQDVMANYLGSDDKLPVTAIAATIQHNTSGIMSRAGEGIDRPRGMEGKRYGTWDQDVEKAIVKSVVETDGGDFSKVELVPSGDEVSGLKSNQFDCVWGYEAWGLQNAKIQGLDCDYWSFRSIDSAFDYYTPVIIANDDFLKDSPEVAKAFLRATKKGYEFCVENPDEAAQILCDAAPETDAELAKASAEYLADQYTADASSWGIIDPDRWAAFYTWMNDNQLTPVALDVNGGFSMDYLEQ